MFNPFTTKDEVETLAELYIKSDKTPEEELLAVKTTKRIILKKAIQCATGVAVGAAVTITAKYVVNNITTEETEEDTED